eukprot:scaffold9904_cov100-Isochrysis_galbana.AAC.5
MWQSAVHRPAAPGIGRPAERVPSSRPPRERRRRQARPRARPAASAASETCSEPRQLPEDRTGLSVTVWHCAGACSLLSFRARAHLGAGQGVQLAEAERASLSASAGDGNTQRCHGADEKHEDESSHRRIHADAELFLVFLG